MGTRLPEELPPREDEDPPAPDDAPPPLDGWALLPEPAALLPLELLPAAEDDPPATEDAPTDVAALLPPTDEETAALLLAIALLELPAREDDATALLPLARELPVLLDDATTPLEPPLEETVPPVEELLLPSPVLPAVHPTNATTPMPATCFHSMRIMRSPV